MPRMSFQDKGFHVCSSAEVEGLVAQGWHVCTDEMWADILLRKRALALPTQGVTILAQHEPVKRSPGRPRKEVPSILNGE